MVQTIAMNELNSPADVTLAIQGMHCASCTGRVEAALRALPGVGDAHASLATNEATVSFDPESTGEKDLIQAVHAAGYEASVQSGQPQVETLRAQHGQELSFWRRRFVAGLSLLGPMLMIQYLVEMPDGLRGACLFALATPAQLYLGWPFLQGAWRRLRHLSTNMDTLVALGTSAAYCAGVVALFTGGAAMYFLDAAMILTFITLGKLLEAKTKGRASEAIRRLLDMTPPEAVVIRDGEQLSIALNQVRLGETILVRPGDKVPLDAEVIDGVSALDESWLTGESLPVEKAVGDTIRAGTINGNGSLTARVQHIAGESALDEVVRLVRKAQESKTDVERLADRVVRWFVPAVIGIAMAALVAWGPLVGDWSMGLMAAIAVLVAACPCALGLATPTAVMVGSGRGAEMGILIKEAHSLETAGRLTTVILDKTGTVTEGKPKVVGIVPASGVGEDELLSTAAAAQQLSTHPLATAIVAEAKSRELAIPDARDLQVVPGAGIRAQSDRGEILVGNQRLFESIGLEENQFHSKIETWRKAGRTPVLVALAGQPLGVIALADTPAPHSREAVKRLHAMGLSVQLLTGDHESTARAIAGEVGIRDVKAEVLPAEKQQVVAQLRAAGEVVAMVGDGINDAPALAEADLGIAIGAGADVALEAADIVLTHSDLADVPGAIALSRATLRTIKQNLVWAFAYNIALLPLAAGVFVPLLGIHLPPAAAAAAMAASSVSVVANSLLLRHRKLR
jgi:Cu+-exporting ATPase